MFGKAKPRGEGVKLAVYMMKGHPGEVAELIDMRGFGPVSDFRDGMRNEHIRARDGTNGEKPFLHAHFRSAAGEGKKLSREQWLEIAGRCDRALGLTGQPRAASLHIDRKTGDMHLHLGYSLVAEGREGRLYIKKIGLYKNKLKELCRGIERDYGLRVLDNERQPGDRAKAAGRNEFEESRRLDTDLKAIRTAILDSFENSDNGKSFAAAMRAQGMELAAGDRRDCFVVIDAAGGQHGLNKKLTGKTLAQIRERLSDLNRAQLPGVDQAKGMQAERAAARAAQERGKRGGAAEGPEKSAALSGGQQRAPQPEIKPLGKTAGEMRMAWRLTATAAQFQERLEDKGLILVHVSYEEAETSHRAHVFAKAIGNERRELREGFAIVDQRGNVTRIDQRVTGDQWEEIQKRLGGIDKNDLISVAAAKEQMRATNRAEWERKKAQERIDAPVTGARAAIREAWTQSCDPDPARDAEKLQEALAARNMVLARGNTEDARASQRQAELYREQLRQHEAAKQTAARGRYADLKPEVSRPHYAPVIEAGEIVAINAFGNVYKLDERSTGQFRDEIDRRLAGIHADDLLSVADTKEAMQEARRAAWAEQQRIEREKVRPLTDIETNIVDADKAAQGDRQRFDAELREAGLALGRATEADIRNFDSERKAEAIAAAADPQHAIRFIPQIENDELVAVDRHGGVHRLNQFHLEQIGQRYADWPSVSELRSAFATERETAAKFQQEMIDIQLRRREEAAHAREVRAENREAERTAYRVDAGKEIGGGIDEAGRAATAAPAEAKREARGGLRIIGRLAELVWGTFFGWAMAPPKMTADQAERAERAEEEAAPARAEAARQHAHKAEYDEIDQRRKYARQLEEQQLAAILGGNATAEAQHGRDQFDRTREQERELRRE
jgi:relaxase-like protein